MTKQVNRGSKTSIITLTALTVLLKISFSHSYVQNSVQKQRHFFEANDSREVLLRLSAVISNSNNINYNNNNNNISSNNSQNHSRFDKEQVRTELPERAEQSNSTVILVTKAVREKPSELSQTTMDVITICWYIATFLALAAFFLLMACSDRRCNEDLRNRNGANGENAETNNVPLTPTPSYSEFAPPSYETVMKWESSGNKPNIFLVPCPIDANKVVDNNSSNNSNNCNNENEQYSSIAEGTISVNPTPTVDFYMINELQKLGS